MKNHSATIRGFLLCLLMVPYLLVVLGVLSNYIVFCHRVSFQTQVATSDQDALKTIILSASEFEKIKWVDAGKEFEYSGKMYDVASIEKRGVNYVVSCESDTLEDLFISLIKGFGKSKSKMIPQIQFSPPIADIQLKKLVGIVQKIECTPTGFYLSFSTEIIPPPPRVS